MRDPFNGPEWDLPPTPVRRAYLIASHPRSGSSLLARALTDTGLAGRPWEYLGAVHILDYHRRWHFPAARRLGPEPFERVLRAVRRRLGLSNSAGTTLRLDRWTADDVRHYIDRVARVRTGSNGLFGIKAHLEQVQALWVRPGVDPWTLFPELVVIRLDRADTLAQAISLVRARQSAAWTAGQAVRREPVYDRTAIDGALAELRAWDAGWDDVLRGHPPPLKLTYEGLISDWSGTLGRALGALGVDTPASLPAPALERQRKDGSEAWATRYSAGG